MARILMVHACAERERIIADGAPDPQARWDECGSDLVDAISGVWTAGVSR